MVGSSASGSSLSPMRSTVCAEAGAAATSSASAAIDAKVRIQIMAWVSSLWSWPVGGVADVIDGARARAAGDWDRRRAGSKSACTIAQRARAVQGSAAARGPQEAASGVCCRLVSAMTPETARVIDATGALLSPLLAALERVGWVQRHLYPPVAGRLAEALTPDAEAVGEPLAALEALACPEEIRFMRDRVVEAARETVDLARAFAEAAASPGDSIGLYRALRRFARVQEALYPLAPVLEPLSRWFLDPARRGDDALVARLRDAALREDGARAGVLHADNDRGRRGGFSLYVSESWSAEPAMPPVVALLGGSGHGRDFLWSWLRDVRAREMLLLSPTSRDRTWSIMGGEDVD